MQNELAAKTTQSAVVADDEKKFSNSWCNELRHLTTRNVKLITRHVLVLLFLNGGWTFAA